MRRPPTASGWIGRGHLEPLLSVVSGQAAFGDEFPETRVVHVVDVTCNEERYNRTHRKPSDD